MAGKPRAKKQTTIKNRKYSAEDVVVNDDFSFVSPSDGKTYKMTLKEQSFCEAYLEFKGDGVDAVFEAGYEAKNALVAAGIAYENLRKPNLIAYINSKLEEYGFNDDAVFKQHLYVLQQHADLKSKVKAIDMFYKLKGTYAPEKKHVVLEAEAPLDKADVSVLDVIDEHYRDSQREEAEVDGASADPLGSKA